MIPPPYKSYWKIISRRTTFLLEYGFIQGGNCSKKCVIFCGYLSISIYCVHRMSGMYSLSGILLKILVKTTKGWRLKKNSTQEFVEFKGISIYTDCIFFTYNAYKDNQGNIYYVKKGQVYADKAIWLSYENRWEYFKWDVKHGKYDTLPFHRVHPSCFDGTTPYWE